MGRGRFAVQTLLAGREHDYEHMARPLLRALERMHHFDLGRDSGAVVLAASDVPLTEQQARELDDFVRHGGGVVLLHGTLAAWSDSDVVAGMAGWRLGEPAPLTDLIVRTADHPLTDRLSQEIRLRDELYLSEGPPGDARVLLRASWRFTDQVVAYERRHGEGRFVHIGLGHGPETYANADFIKLVHRAVVFAAGGAPSAETGVGLIGYGAIARGHAESIKRTRGLRLQAVADISPERRDLAARELSVKTYVSADELMRDPDVGMVLVGTPPSVHADPVVAALQAGKHVVCEKPFAITVDDVDRMVDAAAANHRVLTVYQSRRWDPDYIAMRDAIASGRIGDVFYMESFIGGYSHPCDFWHSHEPISGGTIYDWGSHYFDWILQMFEGPVKHVSAVAHKRVWHDVTNADQVRVDLTFDSGAQATFMQSDIAAALKPKWYVLGTRGAVVGQWRPEADPPAAMPATVTVLRPADGGGTHEERLALAPRDEHGFYRNLADHLSWDEPLAVSAQEARRTVAVMEAATESIRQDGARIDTNI